MSCQGESRRAATVRAAVGSLALMLCASSSAYAQGADDDMDDILGGFEDEDPDFNVEESSGPEVDRWWDLSGSMELSATVNLQDH